MASTFEEAYEQALNARQIINDVFIVDAQTRSIQVPENETLFGVYTDHNVERKYFRCPRVVGDGVDLSECYIFINYISSGGNPGRYHCDDVQVVGENIEFTWLLSENVFDVNLDSFVYFAMQAKKYNEESQTYDNVFNTTKAQGYVFETVAGNETVIEEKHADVILQIIGKMDVLETRLQTDAVLYTEQTNTTARKTQARTNIGAASASNPVFTGSVSMGRKSGTTKGTNSTALGSNVSATAIYSHAEGQNTEALGTASHTEGYGTRATVSYAHAEGQNTQATAQASHAEGVRSVASATGSHAEGDNSKASAQYSHAEGGASEASGDYSHAEGCGSDETYQITRATGKGSHAEGRGTLAQGSASHAEGEATTASGQFCHAEGKRTQATANASHSEGMQTKATNSSAHSEGYATEASGDSSHAEGQESLAQGTGSHAEGLKSEAEGDYSHAEGQETRAGAITSHAEGYQTEVTADGGHAEGWKTKVSAQYGHSEGAQTEATGEAAHAEGWSSQALGAGSHAEGLETIAEGIYAHSEGMETLAQGKGSHAEGSKTVAGSGEQKEVGILSEYSDGQFCHAEGVGTLASGKISHAEGHTSIATGEVAHAEGSHTQATGNFSHTEGAGTIVTGDVSHAEGSSNMVSGKVSHAEGYGNSVIGDYCHVEGQNNVAYGNHMHVQGRYNKFSENDNFAHVVGNGKGTNARSNAHTVDWDGNAEYQGDVKANACGGATPISLVETNKRLQSLAQPLVLDVAQAEQYLEDSTAGDETLKAILAGMQVLVRVPNADGGTHTAIYSPIYMHQLPNYENNYLYVWYLRDEKQNLDLSALGAGAIELPVYERMKLLLSETYNETPLKQSFHDVSLSITSGATCDNKQTLVKEGNSYKAIITGDTVNNRYIATAEVTMGGVDITSTAYSITDNVGTVNIENVTGDIYIKITTEVRTS